MDKETEIVMKTLAEKIEKLESEKSYYQWKIEELIKEIETLKNVEKRPLEVVGKETR